MGCVMNRGGLMQVLTSSWALRTPLGFPLIMPLVGGAGPLLHMGARLGGFWLFIFIVLFLIGCLVVVGCRVISLSA
jgi:hypothetical protein